MFDWVPIPSVSGLVDSFARPGGNVTGISLVTDGPKRQTTWSS